MQDTETLNGNNMNNRNTALNNRLQTLKSDISNSVDLTEEELRLVSNTTEK